MTQQVQQKQTSPEVVRNYDPIKLLHTAIGLSLMFLGKYVPSPTMVVESSPRLLEMGFPAVDGGVLLSMSPLGMNILLLFLGVVYLWSTVDTVWPGLLGVVLLGFSDYAPMNAVLSQFMGNPMTVYIFFLMVFSAILVHSNISAYLARWMLTLPIVRGKPWAITGMFLFASYCVACVEQVSAVFLMWPALYVLFECAGYKKGEKYTSLMLVNCIIMILLSFATDPIKGGSFYVLSNLYNLAANNPEMNVPIINNAYFMLFGFTISIISMFCLLLSMKFVFRVDVSKLRDFNPDELNRNPLPPMTWQQKCTIIFFLLFAFYMLLPGILGKSSALGAFLGQNMLAGTMIVVCILSFINFRGMAAANIDEYSSKFPWRVYLLIAVALFLGGAMVKPTTHVSIFMEYALRTLLEGMSYIPLVIFACGIAMLATNFCNSVASGLIFTPVLIATCNALGFPSAPLLACFFFTTMIAAVTPAASPFAALLFANKAWIDTGVATRYSLVSSIIVLVVISIVGVPMATMLF